MTAGNTAKDVLTGSCMCGTVRFQIRPPFSKFVHCHCSCCRKATGAAHASNIYVAPAQLTWLSGQETVVRFDLPAAIRFALWYCRHYGARVPRPSRSGRTIVVPAGRLGGRLGVQR